MIEAITGEPYGVWVQREIVDAAGLLETTPDAPVPNGATLARGHGGKALLGRRLVFPGDQSTHALASATGFVSTAADLARFFGQLSPNAERSVLSVASRREMSRPQWKDPWSPLAQSYGLGTISGSFDGWDHFGHSGGFTTRGPPVGHFKICSHANTWQSHGSSQNRCHSKRFH